MRTLNFHLLIRSQKNCTVSTLQRCESQERVSVC